MKCLCIEKRVYDLINVSNLVPKNFISNKIRDLSCQFGSLANACKISD